MSEFVLLYRDTVDARKKMPIPCEDSDGHRQTAAYTRALSLTANAVEYRYLWRKCP